MKDLEEVSKQGKEITNKIKKSVNLIIALHLFWMIVFMIIDMFFNVIPIMYYPLILISFILCMIFIQNSFRTVQNNFQAALNLEVLKILKEK